MESQLTANTEGTSSTARLNFKLLPRFAAYLLDNKLREYTKDQLNNALKADFPIMRLYDLSIYTEEQLVELSMPSHQEFLLAMSQNRLEAHIDDVVKKWENNELPNIGRDQLVVEDITMATHVRKKTLISYIPFFTSDIHTVIELVKEIDDYVLEACLRSFNTYISIHKEKIITINESLLKHEADLLEAQAIADLGSFEWSLNGGKSRHTPQVFRIFELSQASPLEEFMDYVHPGDREKLRAAIDKAVQGGRDYECEYRYRKNGKEKVIWSKGLVNFADNKPVSMKGTVMDITERHYMLQRLKRNEELYKQAQKLTHIGNWTLELENSQLKLSDEMYTIYGLQIGQELSVAEFDAFMQPDERQLAEERMKQSLETHEPHTLDYSIMRRDGSIRSIRRHAEILTDEKGRPYKVAGTGQDITKEVLLIKELREREENFSQLIANAPEAVIVTDELCSVLLWNPKTVELFGWSREEILGRELSGIIIPEQPQQKMLLSNLKKRQSDNAATAPNSTLELTALNRNGENLHVSLTISQFRQSGRLNFIFFIRDISDEKKIRTELIHKTAQLADLNVSLEQKNIALERSNKELTSFSYVASHDLQEPIRKIKSFSNQIIETENNLSQSGRDCFNRIIQSSARMQKLIEDLLSFSRTQVYEKTFTDVDLNQVIAEIESLHVEAISGGTLSISIAKLPVLNAVKFQIQQLFENLVSNSLKYSKQGIKTELVISSEAISSVQVPFFNSRGVQTYHRISLKDNGIGFDPKYSEKIFEIFQRLHSRSEYSGTGIGLSICKKIVENHHGFIKAHGTPNEGATFDVYFPAN